MKLFAFGRYILYLPFLTSWVNHPSTSGTSGSPIQQHSHDASSNLTLLCLTERIVWYISKERTETQEPVTKAPKPETWNPLELKQDTKIFFPFKFRDAGFDLFEGGVSSSQGRSNVCIKNPSTRLP